MGSDSQEVTFDERDLDLGRLRRIHRGHGEHASGGVVVVAEGIDQHGPALGQDGGVVLRDGAHRGRGHDLHADDAQRRRDPVGDRVGEGVGPGLLRPKVDGAAVEIRGESHARRGSGDGGEGQRVAVGVGVVPERVEGDGLARVCLEEVAVGRGRQVTRLLDVDDELAARLGPLVVRHRQDDGLGPGGTALLVNRHGAVFDEGDVQAGGSLHVLEVDRVAIGVTPVAEGLVLDPRAHPDLDGGGAHLNRRLVLPVGMDRDLNAGGGGGLPVRRLVGEGRGSALVRRDVLDLQGAPAARHDHRAPPGLRGRGGGQHVPVQV